MQALKASIIKQIETAGGRHDEPKIYSGTPGDIGLAGGPGSISWEINGDFSSVAVAGLSAILMEVLHPSVMDGVFTQSAYRTNPLGRARNTLGYVLRTTFGTTEAATQIIGQVKLVHSRINGTRGDGVSYRALEPELIAWVHTCIPWAIMKAFERYNRPLSLSEKDRYLAEQAVIGRLGGADWVPESVAELDDYIEQMRPLMAFNDQTRQFTDFLLGTSGDVDTTRYQRFDAWMSMQGSMALMPDWARKMTGTYHSEFVDRLSFKQNEKFKAKLLRWALPVLPCKTLALERANSEPAVSRQPTDRAEQSSGAVFSG
ncbi:MAG: oxygenase MpaB family protein [Oceanicoccus sp.]